MNDFTKEELEALRNDHWFCGANFPGLYVKLTSMIDNYCDHEWVNGTYCEKCDQTPTGGK